MQSSTKLRARIMASAAPVIIVAGDKGGVGKSFTARAIAAYLRTLGFPIAGFDCDNRNAHLERFAGNQGTVSRHNIRDEAGRSELLAAWENVDRNKSILMDTPGGAGDVIEADSRRIKLLAEALNRRLFLVWVASEEEDSIWLLKPMLELFPPSQVLFMMNGRFGPTAAHFKLWNGSRTRADFLANGGREALLPALSILPRAKIARARCAFDNLAAAQLTLTERIDFDLWWQQVTRELEPFAKLLEDAR